MDDYGLNETAKEPPHSIQAEQSVLGGLMLSNQSWGVVSDKLVETDFYRKDHQLIFRTISRLAEKQEPFDVITLSESLKSAGEFNPMGWLVYLGMLARDTPSAANIAAYAEIVRDRSILRQLIHVGTEISDSAFTPEGLETQVLFENAIQKLSQMMTYFEDKSSGLVHIKEVIRVAYDELEDKLNSDSKTGGLETPWSEFNRDFDGLPNDVVVIAARPGMGKSTAAENITLATAKSKEKKGQPIAFFSLEVPATTVVFRLISAQANIDITKLISANLDDSEWTRLSAAVSLLSETDIYIDFCPSLSVLAYESKLEKLSKEHGDPCLIVVDYLQLMTVAHKYSRVEIVAEASRTLKASALKYKCPVLELAQLNRGVESRPDKRPIMSDLAESGQIEKDAYMIIFIYRDEVYNEDSPHKGVAEFNTAKNKNGKTGVTRLVSNLKHCKFESHESSTYDPKDYE